MSELAWPWLAALAVTAGVVRAALRGRREMRAWLGRDPAGWARPARAGALSLAAVCLALALRSALGTPDALSGGGADVVIALDVSESMDVADVPPSRLRRALRTAGRIVEQAKSERLALVVFSGEAFIALPLTQDRDAVLTYLRALDSDVITVRGSELGRALLQAGRVFDPHSSRPRSVVLLTDGEDFGPAPEAEISELIALGARVTAVGYGTEAGGLVPGRSAQGEAVRGGEESVSRRNDGLLRHIAEETGGTYFGEIEDRPAAAQLLPAPEPEAEPAAESAPPDPLAPVLFAVALALAADLWLSGGALRARRRVTRAGWLGNRRVRAAALAIVSLGLGGFGADWIARGDAALEENKSDEALSLYHEAAAARGRDAALSVRIGNALYRLQRIDQAASAYLEALRILRPEDRDTRFAASFNLGNAFVAKKHFEEARDAYWAAMIAEPANVEAKFNYEWALEHIQQTPVPETEDQPEREKEKSGSDSSESEPQRAEPKPELGSLDEREAQRWLDTLEEPVADALRQQVINSTGGRARARPGGKTW